jgi:polar amino acid transport system substrate-binding protein
MQSPVPTVPVHHCLRRSCKSKSSTWRVLVLIGVSLFSASMACADVVSIRADEWAPVNNDPRATQRGIMIETAEAILAQAGHQVDYKIMKWQDALDAVKAGKNDCVVGALQSDVPKGFLTPKQPWVVSTQTVYARSDRDYRVNSINDLTAFSLGVSGSYSYGDALDKYRDDNLKNPAKIYVARSNRPVRDLLLRLNTSQIQLALETSVVMEYNIATANLAGRIKSVGSPTNKPEELFIACSAAKKTSAAYIALFDSGLPKLRASGKFAEILKHYNVSDWAAK